MAYTKQAWEDYDFTKPLSATRMNHIENGIANADESLTEKTGISLEDTAGDDVNNWSTAWSAQRWDLRMGTAANPRQGGGPGVKISQTELITNLSTQMGGAQGQNQANAALHVASRGLDGTLAQTNAILGTASAAPGPGADILAVGGWARARGENGTAFGGYFEGRRDTATAGAIGAEVGVRDYSGTDGVVSTTGGSDSMGIWVSTVGNNPGWKCAAGVVLGAGNGSQYKIGYHVVQNAVFNHAFRDESGSQVSFMSRGTHNTGVDMATATFTENAIKLPTGTDATSGIRFGDIPMYRSASGRVTVDGTLEQTPPSWVTPTLGNSWSAVDTPRAPRYRKDGDGTVRLAGMMTGGTTSTAVFTLPSGSRPVADEDFLVVADSGMARVKIATTGVVAVWSYAAGGSNASVSLSGIAFSTV